MSKGDVDEEIAFEVMGEYLAAFLAVEQDWGVIDSLIHARTPQEALEQYVFALRSIHRVLDKKGGIIYAHVKEVLKKVLPVDKLSLSDLIEKSSKVIESKLDRNEFKEVALKLVERALAKYARYHE